MCVFLCVPQYHGKRNHHGGDRSGGKEERPGKNHGAYRTGGEDRFSAGDGGARCRMAHRHRYIYRQRAQTKIECSKLRRRRRKKTAERTAEMIKIDLITGFLGSGKTTFLKQYAKYLMAQGKNIGILENDFGAVNVDMLLLQELRGDQCELEMISGGCDKETHRRRFRTKLISMGMSGYDRILVEPSGIYDVDEFFDTLYDEPLNRWYEAGSVITILDAGLDEKLSEEEEYLLASEAANAGKIVLSKVQNVSEEKKEETIAHLNRTLEQAGCRRQFSDAEILQKNWDDLTEDDFKMLSECSYRSEDYRKLDFGEQQTFDSLCFLEPKITEEALKKAAEAIFADPSCGNVFRIKGIVKTGETVWSEINATREQMTFQAVPESQEVLIVIGAGLSKERISGILGIK